jgi:D-glycero-alpha-D-manno-heptose-7-phosphate kinase
MRLLSAPYRVSISGGGSDFREWFQHEQGAVFSFSTQQCIRALAHVSLTNNWHVRYRQVDVSPTIGGIQHEIVKKSVELLYPDCPPLEISSHGELPGHQTGMGASSAFTTGMVSLLLHLSGHTDPHPELVAHWGERIEIEGLGRCMGLQEIYASAYGGVNLLMFEGEDVDVYPIPVRLRRGLTGYMNKHCFLVYVPETTSGDGEFKCYKSNLRQIEDRADATRRGVALAIETFQKVSQGEFDFMAEALQEAWGIKKANHDTCSSPSPTVQMVDHLNAEGMPAKLCGGGGKGFIFVCLRNKEDYTRLSSFCTAHSLVCVNTSPRWDGTMTQLLSTSTGTAS